MNPDETVAEVHRRLLAAPEKVFSAFAEARLVSRWLSPSPEIALTVLRFDFRIGGAYRFAYHIPGGKTMIVNGAYRSIEAPSMIIFSWNIEPPDEHAGLQSEVTATITPDGNGTELRIRHEKLTLPGAVERHIEGWRGALDRLAEWLSDRNTPVREERK
jgi:uncharacterized protein YndB with AHSA1/START domain